MVKIVVIGSTGEMGRLVVRSLLESGNGYEIIATGRRNLSALVDYLKQTVGDSSNRISIMRLDLNDLKAIDETVAGAKVLVNCSGPYYRLSERLLLAALKAGCHYVDLADEIDAIERLLSYHPLAQKQGVTAVVGMGWTPGLTNIAARAGVELLEQTDTIRIHWVGSAADSPGLAVIEHVLHVALGETWQYESGRLVQRQAMSGRIKATLPPPFGSLVTYYLAHPEPVTLCQYFPKVNSIEVRGVIVPPAIESVMSFINRVRLIKGERGRLLLARAAKRLLSTVNLLSRRKAIPASAFVVEVEGLRDGKRVCVKLSAKDSMARLTALPCFICARELAAGELDQPGVHSPEAVVSPESIFKALEKYGLSLDIDETLVAAADELPVVADRFVATIS